MGLYWQPVPSSITLLPQNTGQLRVFEYNSAADRWQWLGQIINGVNPSDLLGFACALSADGSIVATGACRARSEMGNVSVFEYNRGSNRWQPVGQTLNGSVLNERFGSSVPLSDDGTTLAAAAYDKNSLGVVRVCRYNSST